MSTILLDNVDANTVGEWFVWNGGPSQVFVVGDDFGGGNVILELSNDAGATPIPAKFTDGTDFMAAENDSFPICGWAQGVFVRATLQGATAPSNVRVVLQQA